MRSRIGALNTVELHVALYTTGVVPLDIVAGNTALDVPSRPLPVTPPSGPNAAQNPGQDLSRHRAVPDWLEPFFLSLDAMAIDTIIGLVTGLALPFFPDCIKRM